VKAGVRARKRPVVVDAMQWTGSNVGPLKAWMAGFVLHPVGSDVVVDQHQIAMFVKRRATGMTETLFRNLIDDPKPEHTAALWVAATESYLPLVDGEWVLHDSAGFYPCLERIFAESYDVIDDG
jgi:hypothetical protein